MTMTAPAATGQTRPRPASARPGSDRSADALLPAPGDREPRPAPAGRRSRSAAARRAYARRAQRIGRWFGDPSPAGYESDQDGVAATGRASFVVLVMGLLVVGVIATLWLSTQAVADSYQLERVKQESTELAERAARLQREVTKAESASALAEQARRLGMVPAGDPARLVVAPDGSVTLVGEAEPATAPDEAESPPADSSDDRQPNDQQVSDDQQAQQVDQYQQDQPMAAPGAG